MEKEKEDMKDFFKLTKADINRLRQQEVYGNVTISQPDIDAALIVLQHLYTGRVNRAFAERIVLKYKLSLQ